MSKRQSEQEVVDVFADLFNKTVDVQHHIPTEGVPHDDSTTKKYMPKVEDWYPIYADGPNSYQADLTVRELHKRTRLTSYSVCH